VSRKQGKKVNTPV